MRAGGWGALVLPPQPLALAQYEQISFRAIPTPLKGAVYFSLSCQLNGSSHAGRASPT